MVAAADVADVTEQDISKMMVGRDISMDMKKKPVKRREKYYASVILALRTCMEKKR